MVLAVGATAASALYGKYLLTASFFKTRMLHALSAALQLNL
jgi:hypothetical protein